MSNKIWQDETVQALKHGYQEEIEALRNYITALETAGRNLQSRLDEHFGGDPSNDWKEQAELRALLGETK